MVFFEAFKALFSIDPGFFLDVITGNLLWVFAFACVNHVLFRGKNLLLNTALFSVYIWAFREFAGIWGMGGFAIDAFVFFGFVALMQLFVLEPKLLGKHTAFVDVMGFYSVIFFLNFFAR